MVNEDDFMVWFMKNYKPDPKNKGWYIDKIIKGASATVEGARSQYVIIQEVMKTNPFAQSDAAERSVATGAG
jgi:hypothetical protein